ncbi:MAG TPA: hypothetical protein PKA84_13475 [Rubrivivax sp.]|nr:hypothetical protein [Burkholderiaceae bacterium]HMR71232.1 hypothetical protein [Rubrivivax sp.]
MQGVRPRESTNSDLPPVAHWLREDRVLWQHATREELDLAAPMPVQRVFGDVPHGPHWLMRRGRQAPACG